MKTFRIPFRDLGLTSDMVIKDMGYVDMQPELFVLESLDNLFSMVESRVEASCVFGLFEGETTRTGVDLRNMQINTGSTIASLLKNSNRFAVFAATAGEGFEKLIHEIDEEGDILKSYILDIIGTCIAEKAGDYLERQLEVELDGIPHTNRFSPGYCNWLLMEQQKLFELLGGNPCDIRLSEVCLMLPVKSISGIIGTGHGVSRKKYACDICDMETCYKRRETSSYKVNV